MKFIVNKTIISFSTYIAVCLFILSSANGQIKEKIDSAVANGEVIFMVVCNGNDKLTEAKMIADSAQKEVTKSRVIILDKKNKLNAALIENYKLSNAPAPGILVIASNGIEAKRFSLNQVTTKKLLEAIPTKKQTDILSAFNQNKSVFLILSRDSLSEKNSVIEECEKSCVSMQNYAVIIDINMEDQSERKFLKSLNTDFSASKTKVLVFNSKGKFIKEFEAPVNSAKLTNAALEDSDCPCSKEKFKEKDKKHHK